MLPRSGWPSINFTARSGASAPRDERAARAIYVRFTRLSRGALARAFATPCACVVAAHRYTFSSYGYFQILLLNATPSQKSTHNRATGTPVNRSELIKFDQSRSTPVKAVAGQSRSAKPVKAGQNKPVKS